MARPPRPRVLRAGPFAGVRDSGDATSATPKLAAWMENCYARDPERKSAVLGRPGFTTTEGGVQLGSGGTRRVQWTGQLRQLDGPVANLAVVGGLLYRYDWGADDWSAIALTGGAALSASAPAVYGVTFADQLILSDGVNTPFAWDGATFTVLSALGAAAYGQPWVHQGCLFVILADDRATITWSEPNQLIGFEATVGSITYRNAWTLGQTSQDALVAGRGLNDRMLLWRARSTTEVFGSVDGSFSTAGTRESVSETVGCGAPNAVVIVDGTAFWLSADTELYALDPMRGLVHLGAELSESEWDVSVAHADSAVATYDPLTDVVIVGVPFTPDTLPNDCWVVNASTLQAQGGWRGWGEMTALGTVIDPTGNPVRLHGGTDGRIYRHGHPRGALWNDVSAAGAAPIRHVVRTPLLGWDEMGEKFWDRLDVMFRARSALTQVSVQPIGPYGSGDTIAAAVNETDVATLGEFVLGTDRFPEEGLDQHLAVGLETHGRWQQFEIRHEVAGEQFGLLTAAAWVQDVAAYPEVP